MADSNPQNVTALAIDLQTSGYDERGGLGAHQPASSMRSQAEPAFESATPRAQRPAEPRGQRVAGRHDRRYAPRSDEDLLFLYNVVGSGLFPHAAHPAARRAANSRAPTTNAAPAVIVNETLARRMWQTPENAIGKRLRAAPASGAKSIGVARDLKYARLSEEPRPFVYYPLLQTYMPALTFTRAPSGDSPTRCAGPRSRAAARSAIPIVRSIMLAEQTRVALSVYELAAGALTMFGVMTIVLAAIGIYGLVAYTVQQSTQEIGIRMAVGAAACDVVWDFLRRGAMLAGDRRRDRPGAWPRRRAARFDRCSTASARAMRSPSAAARSS